jgi:demethylmenaquinone methyltransferase / 2-methoxy-6-polyprenyl-1,4-benzoquinol methylase
MTETSAGDLVHQFFPGTGMTYDHMVNLCTIGFDGWWKKKMVERIPGSPAGIMDQACGTGILTIKIAQTFPGCRVVGVDVLEEYLDIAKAKVRALKVGNVEFFLGRAEEVRPRGTFDCITSSYLAKYADLPSLTRSIEGMLSPGGSLIMHDFTYPSNRQFAAVWEFYFRLLQAAGAWKYPQWRPIFYGLPGLIRKTNWVNDLTVHLKENGFRDIDRKSLTFGTSAIIMARKVRTVRTR